jgi:hypothetical protein
MMTKTYEAITIAIARSANKATERRGAIVALTGIENGRHHRLWAAINHREIPPYRKLG